MKLKEKLDRIFSQYIRLRDMMMPGRVFRCISCGTVMSIRQADCGHYINRQHMATRYSEVNCNAQCRHCNRFDEGNMSGYRAGLVKKYGETKVIMLEAQKNEVRKYSDFEYQALIAHYQKEVKRMLDEMNEDRTCLTR